MEESATSIKIQEEDYSKLDDLFADILKESYADIIDDGIQETLDARIDEYTLREAGISIDTDDDWLVSDLIYNIQTAFRDRVEALLSGKEVKPFSN